VDFCGNGTLCHRPGNRFDSYIHRYGSIGDDILPGDSK
jgi:hypothetical protein